MTMCTRKICESKSFVCKLQTVLMKVRMAEVFKHFFVHLSPSRLNRRSPEPDHLLQPRFNSYEHEEGLTALEKVLYIDLHFTWTKISRAH